VTAAFQRAKYLLCEVSDVHLYSLRACGRRAAIVRNALAFIFSLGAAAVMGVVL